MVEIGGKVEIILNNDGFKEIKGFSMIQDVTGEGELVVTLPMFEGRPILINPKDAVRIFFFREEGSFCFKGEIVERFKLKNMVVIRVKQISSIKKIQRRQFYRLKVVLPIEFTVLDEENKAKNSILEGSCIDISGNGLGLYTDYRLEVNTIIECKISLDNEDQLLVKGKVVRVGLTHGLAYKYDAGITFHEITDRTRDELIKFIFNKQRELRKKGFI